MSNAYDMGLSDYPLYLHSTPRRTGRRSEEHNISSYSEFPREQTRSTTAFRLSHIHMHYFKYPLVPITALNSSNMARTELKVALVGDSVLDDHYWLDDPADDVRAQTERTLKASNQSANVTVFNFAVDESMVSLSINRLIVL